MSAAFTFNSSSSGRPQQPQSYIPILLLLLVCRRRALAGEATYRTQAQNRQSALCFSIRGGVPGQRVGFHSDNAPASQAPQEAIEPSTFFMLRAEHRGACRLAGKGAGRARTTAPPNPKSEYLGVPFFSASKALIPTLTCSLPPVSCACSVTAYPQPPQKPGAAVPSLASSSPPHHFSVPLPP